jgi:hypothetical protein
MQSTYCVCVCECLCVCRVRSHVPVLPISAVETIKRAGTPAMEYCNYSLPRISSIVSPSRASKRGEKGRDSTKALHARDGRPHTLRRRGSIGHLPAHMGGGAREGSGSGVNRKPPKRTYSLVAMSAASPPRHAGDKKTVTPDRHPTKKKRPGGARMRRGSDTTGLRRATHEGRAAYAK